MLHIYYINIRQVLKCWSWANTLAYSLALSVFLFKEFITYSNIRNTVDCSIGAPLRCLSITKKLGKS
jgi:hypothetical protein